MNADEKREHNWAVRRIRYEREKQDWLTIGIVHSEKDGNKQPVPLQIALVSSKGEVVFNALIRPPVSWKKERISDELLALMKASSDELFQAQPWQEIVPLLTKSTMHKTLVCWDLSKTKQLLTVLARGKNKGVTLPSNRRFLNMANEYPYLIIGEGAAGNNSAPPVGDALAIALRLAEMMQSFDNATEYAVSEGPTVYHAAIHLDLGRLNEHSLQRKDNTYDFGADEEETREYLEATKKNVAGQLLVQIGCLTLACLVLTILFLGGCLGRN